MYFLRQVNDLGRDASKIHLIWFPAAPGGTNLYPGPGLYSVYTQRQINAMPHYITGSKPKKYLEKKILKIF